MLKISVLDSPSQRTLVLEGTLVEPWVAELSGTWNWAKECPAGQQLVIDLKDVTQISRTGECALLEVMRDGAKFFSDGVLTKHIVRQLTRQCRKQPAEQECAPSTSRKEAGVSL